MDTTLTFRFLSLLAALVAVAAPAASEPLAVRPLTVREPYLVFPVDNDARCEKCYVDFRDAQGEVLHSAVFPIAADGKGAWNATVDMRPWTNRALTLALVKGPKDGARLLSLLKPSPTRGDPAGLYAEANRLQFHFTPPVGYMNDPNGLVYLDGEWRLLYQHAPYTFGPPWSGASQYWGCATSRDLVHWTNHGDVLRPYPGSYNLISGSGVVDVGNTAGYGANAHIACVVGRAKGKSGMLLFHSSDGRAFTPAPTNPHLCPKRPFGCDPKVIWHAPTKKWISASWGVSEGCCAIYFHSSPDLKRWTHESTYFGDHYATRKRASFLFECPGLVELKIEGEPKSAWVVWEAGALYSVGDFDGHAFKPYRDHERLLSMAQSHALGYYAGQAFQNAPDGRCVYIPWFTIADRGPHFSQAMGLPQDLTLRRTNAGLRLVRRPVRELAALRTGGGTAFELFEGELVEAHVAVEATPRTKVSLDLRGVSVEYDAARERLRCGGDEVHWPLRAGRLDLRLFLDRQGLECFSSCGLDCWAFPRVAPAPANRKIKAFAHAAKRAEFTAWKLSSIWR